MVGRIPQSFIDNLLARTDIADIIGARIELKKAGVNYKACCPFHDEKTPSFIVNPIKQFYHCFGGCGANGSAISFLMAYEHMSFPEAVDELATMVGLAVPREDYQGPSQTPSPLYSVLNACADFFQRQLKSQPTAIDYLKRRGLSGATAKLFGLGYAPDRWDALEAGLPQYQRGELLAAGMLVENDNGKIYDRFRDRIMFPIRDRRGRVIGFGGRVTGNTEPKYLNSPETPVFHKSEALYGLFEARQFNRKLDSLLVVEGYMDVIGLAQHGIDNAVATLGTATTAEHLQRLFRVVDQVVFCFDGDHAGRQAAWRALKTLLPVLRDGREARFLFLDEGEDPDSLIKTVGKQKFEEALENAEFTADFLLRELCGTSGLQSIGDRTRLAEAAKPLIASIPGEVYRRLFYRQLSKRVGITIGEGDKPPLVGVPPARRKPAYQIQLNPMRSAVTLALQHPAVVDGKDLDRYDFDESQAGGPVLQKLIGIILGTQQINTAALLEHFRDRPEWHYLCQLASSDIPNLDKDDGVRAHQLFIDSIDQLALAYRRRANQAFRERASDDELKAQLRTHSRYVD